MIKKALNYRTNTITSAAFVLAASGVLSAILGLLRDRLLTGNLGASAELDIYYAAFKIPDLIVSLLISGGVIASFLPVFSEQFLKEENKAWELTNNALNIFLIFSIIICSVLAIFAPYLVEIIVPGFSLEHRALTAQLTQIILISPIFFGISNIFSSVLQYFNRFIFYAIAPIFYNLSIIFGILFFLPRFGLIGLALGVILGALLHCLVQFIPSFFCGFSLRPRFDISSPEIKKIAALMLPRTISATASRLNIIIITAIASTLGAGSIAMFNLSDNLRSLPIGIIGGSFAIASYSFLARFWADGKKEDFFKSLSLACRQTIFVILPLSFLLFALREHIVTIVLGSERFILENIKITAASLGLFSLGILAYSLIPTITRAFFAVQNTKTPLYISLIATSFSIGFSLVFVWLFQNFNFFASVMAYFFEIKNIHQVSVLGFPIAISLAGYIHLFLLGLYLHKKIGNFKQKDIWQSFKKILFAAIISSFLVYLLLFVIYLFVDIQNIILEALLISAAGIFFYISAAKILKIEELNPLLRKAGIFIKK